MTSAFEKYQAQKRASERKQTLSVWEAYIRKMTEDCVGTDAIGGSNDRGDGMPTSSDSMHFNSDETDDKLHPSSNTTNVKFYEKPLGGTELLKRRRRREPMDDVLGS